MDPHLVLEYSKGYAGSGLDKPQCYFTHVIPKLLTLGRPETSYTGTLANSVDPDEMPHNVAFHQGLHCLLRQSPSSEKENLRKTLFFENYNL